MIRKSLRIEREDIDGFHTTEAYDGKKEKKAALQKSERAIVGGRIDLYAVFYSTLMMMMPILTTFLVGVLKVSLLHEMGFHFFSRQSLLQSAFAFPLHRAEKLHFCRQRSPSVRRSSPCCLPPVVGRRHWEDRERQSSAALPVAAALDLAGSVRARFLLGK